MARYRIRMRVRFYAPAWLAQLIPAGKDCGDHEWYIRETALWHCYYCQAESHLEDPDQPWVGAPDDEDELVPLAA